MKASSQETETFYFFTIQRKPPGKQIASDQELEREQVRLSGGALPLNLGATYTLEGVARSVLEVGQNR